MRTIEHGSTDGRRGAPSYGRTRRGVRSRGRADHWSGDQVPRWQVSGLHGLRGSCGGHRSCGDTGRAMSQENVEVVRQAFGAWNRGDIEGYIAHLCSDVQAVPMGAALEGKVWRGHDEIRAWARTHPEVWETLLIWAEEFQQVDEERAPGLRPLGRGRAQRRGDVRARDLGVRLSRRQDRLLAGIHLQSRRARSRGAVGVAPSIRPARFGGALTHPPCGWRPRSAQGIGFGWKGWAMKRFVAAAFVGPWRRCWRRAQLPRCRRRIR